MPPASPSETETEAFRDAAAQREALAWTEAWRPCPDERTYEVTRIEGEIPREIHGTLYRNGPSQRVVPKQGYEALHFFDGNALLHAFRFDDGSVRYTGRYARDARFLYEQEHGADGLSFANLPAESEELPGGYSPNTNVVWHGGKLLALVEADFPFELDPRTLESRGTHLLREEMLGMSTSAHPKIDGRTGQMVIHGYQPIEPYVQLYGVEPDGTCSLAEPVETPYAVMMHDIAITENHLVLPLCPVTWDLEGGACLRDWLRWEPEKGLRVGVRERRECRCTGDQRGNLNRVARQRGRAERGRTATPRAVVRGELHPPAVSGLAPSVPATLHRASPDLADPRTVLDVGKVPHILILKVGKVPT